MKWLTLLIPAFLLVVCVSVVQADTIHVPSQQPTIQAGINAAVAGDTVLVAPDIYVENISFKGKAIVVKSEAGPSVTIINGESPAHPDSASVVRFVSGEDSNSILDGFTLKNGIGTNINPVMDNSITEKYPFDGGGGILCYGASPSIMNNIITENYGWGGGGIFIYYSAPLIKNNLIYNNRAGYGSGIYLWTSDALIINNTFDNNYTENNGVGQVNVTRSSYSLVENNIMGVFS